MPILGSDGKLYSREEWRIKNMSKKKRAKYVSHQKLLAKHRYRQQLRDEIALEELRKRNIL